MIARKILFMALTAGVVLGAAATEGFSVYRQSQDSKSFEQRVHCKAVADTYVKEKSNLRDNSTTGRSVTLEKVDYSPGRNSCVAELETIFSAPRVATEYESVEDLLSGETLFSVSASQVVYGSTAKRTGENLDAFRFVFLPQVWDYVINNPDKPVALEKEFALIESKNPSQTAAPK